jgi:iron complex transport system ATP-binding protein
VSVGPTPDSPRATPALEITDVSARVGGRQVLHGVCLILPPGVFLALVGPNGSGKSTLLRCVTGGLSHEGSVAVGGVPVRAGNARALARRMAYVPQSNPMTFPFTVEELVGLGASGPEAVERALRDVELTNLRSRSVLGLSGGERQRAALARALAQETPLLLLDEPVTHLDPKHQVGILRAVRDTTRAGRAALVVLHDLSLAAGFADRVLLMKDGAILADGTPGETLTPENLRVAYDVPFSLATPPGDPPFLVFGACPPRDESR